MLPPGYFEKFHTIAQQILTCAESALEDSVGGPVEFACVVPGQLAWDACQCGQLAVSSVRTFPSVMFPTEDIASPQARQSHCGHPFLVTEYSVQMIRCAPSPQGTEMSVPCEALQESARILHDDAMRVRNRVFCCLRDLYDSTTHMNKITDFLVSGTTFQGPEGGCVGFETRVFVGITTACYCGGG